mmetsp:Transcript_42459/g.109205  ORF Transcript_42459/g.109205 Transcript_42459/m.109205 type:complete len:94 (+) Transcript_42459:406-687(+)
MSNGVRTTLPTLHFASPLRSSTHYAVRAHPPNTQCMQCNKAGTAVRICDQTGMEAENDSEEIQAQLEKPIQSKLSQGKMTSPTAHTKQNNTGG